MKNWCRKWEKRHVLAGIFQLKFHIISGLKNNRLFQHAHALLGTMQINHDALRDMERTACIRICTDDRRIELKRAVREIESDPVHSFMQHGFKYILRSAVGTNGSINLDYCLYLTVV